MIWLFSEPILTNITTTTSTRREKTVKCKSIAEKVSVALRNEDEGREICTRAFTFKCFDASVEWQPHWAICYSYCGPPLPKARAWQPKCSLHKIATSNWWCIFLRNKNQKFFGRKWSFEWISISLTRFLAGATVAPKYMLTNNSIKCEKCEKWKRCRVGVLRCCLAAN